MNMARHENVLHCPRVIRPRRPCSTWLKNITDDLPSFDMGLLEARDAGINLPGH